MDNFEVLHKKIEKLVRNYNALKNDVSRLKAENSFLNKEVDKLRKTNSNLIDFKNKQAKVVDKIKKIVKKIDLLKGV